MLKLIAALGLAAAALSPALADEAGDALARRVAERAANEARTGTMHFRLTNARGAVRERTALLAQLERGEDARIAIYFEEPARIEGTAFLTYNHDDRADQSWLYLPATERVRRIPAADRGDYFLGTDLTYGDVTEDFAFALSDWRFEHGGVRAQDGADYEVLRGVASSDAVARELGYGGFEALIDPHTQLPVRIAYLDPAGAPLKTAQVLDQALVGEAWTVMRFTVENHQSGHHTEVWFTDMRAVSGVELVAFEPDQLPFGAPTL